jgi:DNA-binding GntR family transcriptional regulator
VRVRERAFTQASYLGRVTVDHASAVPPYRQIAAILRARIKSGDLAPGAAVPSVRTIQQEYGVAQTTARKAIRVLVDEGLAEIVTGWGTFVAKR